MAINEGRGRSHVEAESEMSAGHRVKLRLRLLCPPHSDGKNQFSKF